VPGCSRPGGWAASRGRTMNSQGLMLASERLLTVGEVAEQLQVPRTWVYKHLNRLPYIKLGKYLRFEPSQLDAMLDMLRRRPRER